MIEIFLLSIVQGITEFLPVSSSSHLVLVSEYFEFQNQSLSIDVSLHIGSFIAVLLYFYKDIIDFYKNKTLFLNVLVSSIPTILVGFLIVELNYIDKIRNPEIIACTTIVFAIFLYLSDKSKMNNNIENNFNFKSAISIGMLQILSLIPGVSRSGIAITAARFLRFGRVEAAKISFLLSIPILGAVSIFGLKNILISENSLFTKTNLMAIFLSFSFSFITIKFFLNFLKKFNLNFFVLYRILLGIIILLYLKL
ncbi:undecaprenyl-diphosphate phosphatase [Pelagibacterales bacterium SAG-MED28]|nr:undecaprenyl-diphosphate phosphatase [Pelagibacterales bacterium SAG-MED28]|tara:strand:+ start:2081 stop:2839 length:759 start_codon:yes stop_codon:yes gene_type:complete